MVGIQVCNTGSIKFQWSPFARFSVYRKPIMKFMHRSNQIKQNKKYIILTRTHKTRLHIDPNVVELDTSVIGCKNLTM